MKTIRSYSAPTGHTVALFLLFCLLAFVVTNPAVAQVLPGTGSSSGKDIFNNTQAASVDGGQTLTSGWNIALYWIFMFFKGAAVLMTGWGAFELYKGDLKSMAFSFLAAIVLFFSPTIVDLAFGIGKRASGAG